MPKLLIRYGSAILALLWIGSALPQELNSERIQRLFGSYGVDILHQTDLQRVSSLYSLHDDRHISRTVAVVQFVDPIPPQLETVHADIVAGSSLGTTLKLAGWNIMKRNVYVGSIEVDDETSPIAQLMHLETPVTLAMHVYAMEVHRGGDYPGYATIIEVHHPEQHTETTLTDVFGETDSDLAYLLRERYSALVRSALPP